MFGMMKIPEFTGNLYGYARVSTEEQNLDLQLDALRAAGIPENRIFKEKMSGKSIKRPVLARVRNVMREGDGLVVWRLDRIGRGMVEVVMFIYELAHDKILFRSLNEAVDMTTPMGARHDCGSHQGGYGCGPRPRRSHGAKAPHP